MIAVRSGDQRALETLFLDLHPRLLRFLRAGEPRFADDIAGEVWLAVARGLGTFVGDFDDFRSWVFSIARRRLADHRRNAMRRATSPVDGDYFTDLEAAEGTDEVILERLSAQEAVDLIARHLPADQAELLTLRIVAELDVAHVAVVMDRSPNWVRVTQHRALRRLASALAEPVPTTSKNFDDPVIVSSAQTI